MARNTPPKVKRRGLYWLLVLPLLATLLPQLYAFDKPELFGVPFFYWYQFVWIVLSGVVTGAVYLLTR
jgi:hypothetical protein